jgi:type IV secretory pathway TrbD component
MSNNVTCHRVYRSINKPLMIWGVERRLFFLALVMGAATFNFFGSLFSGVLMFAALYFLARWATAIDPEIMRIILNSSKFRSRYDPAKCERIVLRRERLLPKELP